jgi:hypothetical protein
MIGTAASLRARIAAVVGDAKRSWVDARQAAAIASG